MIKKRSKNKNPILRILEDLGLYKPVPGITQLPCIQRVCLACGKQSDDLCPNHVCLEVRRKEVRQELERYYESRSKGRRV